MSAEEMRFAYLPGSQRIFFNRQDFDYHGDSRVSPGAEATYVHFFCGHRLPL